MKLIIAIVRPFTLEKLVTAFEDIDEFPGMTAVDSSGFGQRLKTTISDTLDPFKPNKRIEIVAPDELVEQIVSSIREHAHTGKKGDGIILVAPIEEVAFI